MSLGWFGLGEFPNHEDEEDSLKEAEEEMIKQAEESLKQAEENKKKQEEERNKNEAEEKRKKYQIEASKKNNTEKRRMQEAEEIRNAVLQKIREERIKEMEQKIKDEANRIKEERSKITGIGDRTEIKKILKIDISEEDEEEKPKKTHKPLNGRVGYKTEANSGLLHVDDIPIERLAHCVEVIESDEKIQEFLNKIIEKGDNNLRKLTESMLDKIEHKTRVIIEESSEISGSSFEKKRMTLIRFFAKHKWLEFNYQKTQYSIINWFIIYKKISNTGPGEINYGKQVIVKQDGSITIE